MRVGINIPWWSYGTYGLDFGLRPTSNYRPEWRNTVRALFSEYRRIGFFAIRWFIFAAGALLKPNPDYNRWQQLQSIFRMVKPSLADIVLSQIPPPQEIPIAVNDDLVYMLNEARRVNLKVMPCIFDFHIAFHPEQSGQWIKFGRADWFNNPEKRALLLRNVIGRILPTMREFRDTIYAVDIINEPEWCTQVLRPFSYDLRQSRVSFNAMIAFIRESANLIRQNSLPPTVGFVDPQTPQRWGWQNLGLEKLQVHYYGKHWYDNSGPPRAYGSQMFLGETSMNIRSPYDWEPRPNNQPDINTISGRLQYIENQGYESVFLWSRVLNDDPNPADTNDWSPETLRAITGWINASPTGSRGPLPIPQERHLPPNPR